jgi:hypothetical protein
MNVAKTILAVGLTLDYCRISSYHSESHYWVVANPATNQAWIAHASNANGIRWRSVRSMFYKAIPHPSGEDMAGTTDEIARLPYADQYTREFTIDLARKAMRHTLRLARRNGYAKFIKWSKPKCRVDELRGDPCPALVNGSHRAA